MTVQLKYTLFVEGAVVDSTEGRGPFSYVHGQGKIIPGLERQLAGLQAGDTRELTVNPEEAYGTADPQAFVQVPKEQLPGGLNAKVGLVLRGTDTGGRPFRAKIHEIANQTFTLDLNHPLAGKTLVFSIEVLDVGPPRAT